MKRSIFALLTLLAVLIIICVYQKTYTIYSTSSNELTLVERKPTTQNTSNDKTVAVEQKEEKAAVLPAFSAPTPAEPAEIKQKPETKSVSAHTPTTKTDKAAEITPVQEQKAVLKTEKTVEKEVKTQTTPSTKNSVSASNVPSVQTKEENTPKPVATEQTVPATQNTGEKEIVDYIMWALKNRDIALRNRDEVEARIQDLITKAINDRQIVLEERSKNEIALIKLQTEQIDARDASYESVINPKTTTQGEK